MLTGTAPGRRRCLRVRVAAQQQPVCPPEMSSDVFPLNSKASFFVEFTTEHCLCSATRSIWARSGGSEASRNPCGSERLPEALAGGLLQIPLRQAWPPASAQLQGLGKGSAASLAGTQDGTAHRVHGTLAPQANATEQCHFQHRLLHEAEALQ